MNVIMSRQTLYKYIAVKLLFSIPNCTLYFNKELSNDNFTQIGTQFTIALHYLNNLFEISLLPT